MSETVITVPVIKPTAEVDCRLLVYDNARHVQGELTAYVQARSAYKMTIAIVDADALPNGSYHYELQDVATDEIIGTGLLVVGDSTTSSPTTYETETEITVYEQ